MTIKEFSARTGVPADTLRYYERMGIIPAVPRKAGGVRVYDENFVEWISFVQTLKASGMSLEAIADYIRLARLGEATCQQRKNLLAQAREMLLKKIETLQTMARQADYQLMSYDTVLRPQTESLIQGFASA
ncbi:MAG: MerR family transcriptional regulator [Phascolarctobacterium sp.]|nr:MAG: MerR family transcriptional regulator [Phascolarctobacterium sp.]